MPSAPKIVDLDAQLGSEPDAPRHTARFRLFGRDWTMVCDLNAFAVSDMLTGEPAAIVRMIDSLVAEDERIDFRTAFASQPNLTAERLGQILNAMIEVAGQRPTTPSSISPRGGRSQTSRPKSAASSSRRPAAR